MCCTVLYIAMSLDGFIAREDDDISFLDTVFKEGEDYGYHAFYASVDTIIMGRRTYEKVLSLVPQFPHAEKKCIVIGKAPLGEHGNVEFYNGPLLELLEKLKQGGSKKIYCDGGAQTVQSLIKAGGLDEMIISIIPVLLGNGIRLFGPLESMRKLRLLSSKGFDTGLVQLHYSFRQS